MTNVLKTILLYHTRKRKSVRSQGGPTTHPAASASLSLSNSSSPRLFRPRKLDSASESDFPRDFAGG